MYPFAKFAKQSLYLCMGISSAHATHNYSLLSNVEATIRYFWEFRSHNCCCSPDMLGLLIVLVCVESNPGPGSAILSSSRGPLLHCCSDAKLGTWLGSAKKKGASESDRPKSQ